MSLAFQLIMELGKSRRDFNPIPCFLICLPKISRLLPVENPSFAPMCAAGRYLLEFAFGGGLQDDPSGGLLGRLELARFSVRS